MSLPRSEIKFILACSHRNRFALFKHVGACKTWKHVYRHKLYGDAKSTKMLAMFGLQLRAKVIYRI